MSQQPTAAIQLVICIRNDEYPASLEVRKVYQTLPDTMATAHHMIRVIDESGEDYLYPEAYFLPIDLPRPIRIALNLAA
ncbi:MAG TPA: hypothetical protein VGD58_08130 [Herpetosiphonaceae bacterium]